MAYSHQQFPFSPEDGQQQNVFYHQQLLYNPYTAQSFHSGVMYNPLGYQTLIDHSNPSFWADQDDNNEPTTRPRLTKEQVDILESHFQANPKPSGVLKRQLAGQISLTLPRVSNWFQNRRAKAKQLRKQEKYENNQQCTQSRQESTEADEDDEDDQEDEIDYTTSSRGDTVSNSQRSTILSSPPRSPQALQATLQEKSWASLQRALAAAKSAQADNTEPTNLRSHIGEPNLEMPPPELLRPAVRSQQNSPQRQAEVEAQNPLQWCTDQEAQPMWSTLTADIAHVPFDFGFGTSTGDLQAQVEATMAQQHDTQAAMLSPETWDGSLITPTMPTSSHQTFIQPLQSPGLPLPSYPGSRRGSLADGLTNNFENFGLTSASSPSSLQAAGLVSPSIPGSGIDLAARRKRPRPAAITVNAGSMRSRSYGALTAASPTFRQGMTPPSAHALRHVKSTGHSLNSHYGHYAGVRKSSIPQRSPLNLSTFAEADAFRKLMAQKAAEESIQNQMTPVTTNPMGHFVNQEQVLSSLPQMVQNGMPVPEIPRRSHVQSPPVTPYNTEFWSHSSSLLPPSTQAQYATTADYTPPYSAGPLTNSSCQWSDVLASPDAATFPPVSCIPSVTCASHKDDQIDYSWMYSTEQSPEHEARTPTDHKKMEFYIQEFPGQKEQHAQVAQQFSRPRPHQYTFNNSQPSDFSK